ncbi:hypothetical protein RRG08_023321 [Elysia crispata]|uniref:Uncharacterized protein n=1 Tax=Elysia crispata TaxID=231223 RepID=A0AAE1BC51_9GAST|nr:hypothetical protein RRG08_023321 [Elysia crispata]
MTVSVSGYFLLYMLSTMMYSTATVTGHWSARVWVGGLGPGAHSSSRAKIVQLVPVWTNVASHVGDRHRVPPLAFLSRPSVSLTCDVGDHLCNYKLNNVLCARRLDRLT